MDARDLYGLPLDRFVPERTALAKELRADGRRAEAASAARLPKPSLAAWAANQLVRTQKHAIADLFEAGDALRRAQEDVIAGRGDARALRDGAERERQALAALVEAARGLLGSDGRALSRVVLDRVSATLHAAALDQKARAQVRDGCLSTELRHVGLGEATAGSSAPGAPASAGRGAQRAPRAERGNAQARERKQRLEAARGAERDARHAADRAASALRKAQQRRDRAAGALADAERELGAAEERAAQATRALRDTRRALEAL